MAGEESRGPGVRVRGIYATGLTQLLQEVDGLIPADPSAAIDRRFDVEFGEGAPVSVDMTDDRQGVAVSGPSGGVRTVASAIGDVGLDTFSWPADAPHGAVFEGEIVDTNRGGAVVELGGGGTRVHGDAQTGFLPFGATEDYLDVGDTVRVQVHEPHPPWTDDDPVLGTEIRAVGDIATLIRGVDSLVAGSPRDAQTRELARTTELLSTTVPDNWGVRWETGAGEADMAVLDDALAAAVETATEIEAALESPEEGDGPIASPTATTWIWFGRESRFALDERRGAVTRTMTGHHRIKAGSEAASTAVDFVERLDRVDGEFPFGPVTEVFGPVAGDTVTIAHGKPDGRCFTLGRGTVTDRSVPKARLTVRREISSRGTYDALGTEREPGDVAITRFGEGRWWYPTLYRGEDGATKGTYVNVATPIEVFPRTVRYVDLHVDVIKLPDGTVETVDEDELSTAVEEGYVSEPLAEQALRVAERVANAFDDD